MLLSVSFLCYHIAIDVFPKWRGGKDRGGTTIRVSSFIHYMLNNAFCDYSRLFILNGIIAVHRGIAEMLA